MNNHNLNKRPHVPDIELKAVLFDLDDTLFDHRYSSRASLSAISQQHTCLQSSTLDELEQMHRQFLEDAHLQMLAGHLSLDAARVIRLQRLFEQHGERIAPAMAVEISRESRRHYQAARRAVPGAIALVEALRSRLKIGIVTNNLSEEQQEKLRHIQLAPLIDVLVISEEVGVTKPDPAIFHIALERLVCQACEVVMIGDSWSTDIIGAHQLGIRAIWLNRYGVDCPDPAMATEIASLEPLEEVLALLF
ncbi:MAG TPA: HAD family hydrolase [Ktedonobacteraceae bacterium]|nr:HAD family hydrolase [Ktedonobacteraceae bacterium]